MVAVTDLWNPEASRIHHYMSTAAGTQETRADILLDEAVIASLRHDHACFDLTIRSTLLADVHPSQWRVKLNNAPAFVEETGPKATETWATTIVNEEVVMRETSTYGGETVVSQPVEREGTSGYTVRSARACAALAPGARTLRLLVELVHPLGDEDWGQVYEWRLLDGAR